MSDKVRKDLLASLADQAPPEAWANLMTELLARHNARDDDFKLEEFVECTAEKDLAKIWEGIADRATPFIDAVTQEDEEEEEEADEPKERGEDAIAAFRVLSAVLALAQACLTVVKKTTLPAGLLRAMMSLHDVLFQLAGLDGEALQAAIAKVCEQWWREERGGAELLVPQLVPYLVARSLEDEAKEALVKRVYAMRGALLLFDYEDEATEPFKLLLLQCFLKPSYLRSADGRRFLTSLFGLHPDLILDIHATVKNQLPYAKRKVVQHYGDVYFRAWKAASGPYLERIEQSCIQELMQCAVSASSPSLYATLRLFLASFHSQKRLREVDSMLLRLYNPIIWRSLQVANPLVRAQAAGLLVDSFPLQDPDAGTVEVAMLLQKQLDKLQSLLEDPDPRVRVAAIAGVCRIMTVFWEALPLNITKTYITRLVSALAFDTSSSLVRLAVVEGLSSLLDQPLSHPVLKGALPLTAPLLHDRAERVRAAFVSLLSRVKAVRDIKFYHVVPVEQLLARFAEDRHSKLLSKRMADLLLNSYFPQGPGVTGAKQYSRCLTFLSQNKPAALAFYGAMRAHVSAGHVTKLAVILLKCIFAALPSLPAAEAPSAQTKGKKGAKAKPGSRAERKRPRNKAEEEDEEGEEGEEEAPPISLEEVVGMLQVVTALWGSIRADLEQPANKNMATMLAQTLAENDITALYKALPNPTPLLELAALSPSCFAPLGPALISALKDTASDPNDARAGPVAALLCSWGRTKDVLDLIASGLESACSTAAPSAAAATSAVEAAGKRKRAAALSLAGAAAAPAKALAMLQHIMEGESEPAAEAREALLGEEGERVFEALAALRLAVEKRVAGATKAIEEGPARAVLVGSVEAWLRLLLHQWGASATPGSASEAMLAALQWFNTALLPYATLSPPADGAATQSPLFSPLSPPPRRPRVDGDDSPKGASAAELRQAAFAQEVLAAALTVVGDWVACGAALDAVSQSAEGWAQRAMLPALMGAQDTPLDRERRSAVLVVMPQMSRLVYQLALQETRACGSLPPPVLEVLIRSADHEPDESPAHRYQDSAVSSIKCLSSLMGLFGRLKSTRPALSSLCQRLCALCMSEPEGTPIRRALLSALARSPAALNVAVGDAVSGLAEAEEGSGVEDKARLVGDLMELAPDKPRSTLLPKVLDAVEAASSSRRGLEAQRKAQRATEGGQQQMMGGEGDSSILAALEGLEKKLQSLAVEAC